MTIDVQNAFCRPQSAFVRQSGQDVAHFLGVFNAIASRVKRLEKTFEVRRIDRCVSQETEHE
jgi:nicotinamidase-related amidase